jgi:DNA repair protein RadC
MQDKFLTMQELPLTDRPYEKLEMFGSRALSAAELLAILIGTGFQGSTALDIAQKMLASYDQLQELSTLTLQELSAFRGIGKAKALRIQAAFELGRRSFHQQKQEVNPTIKTTQDVFRLLGEEMGHLDQEELHVLLLDCKCKLIRQIPLSVGGLNQSFVHPRDVFREAIRSNAAALILVHNHPSGDPTPSRADIKSTRQLKELGDQLGIRLLDHVVIGGDEAVSIMAMGGA